jgi:hypothetical protein
MFHRERHTALGEGRIAARQLADAGQLTHPLDTKVALHRHQFPDLVVDAVSPALVFFWRRASTFCKAPLKKSASSVLSASKRFS